MSTARGLQSAQLASATRAGLPPQSTSARGNNGSAESPVGSQAPGRLLAPTPRRASDSGPRGRSPLPPPEHTSRVQLQGELSRGTALESICLLVCLRAKPVLEWG